MPAYLHKSNILDVQPVVFDLHSVSWFVIDRVEAGCLFETWKPTLAFEKLLIGRIQTPKYLLTSTHIEQAKWVFLRFFVAPITPHTSLIVVAN